MTRLITPYTLAPLFISGPVPGRMWVTIKEVRDLHINPKYMNDEPSNLESGHPSLDSDILVHFVDFDGVGVGSITYILL